MPLLKRRMNEKAEVYTAEDYLEGLPLPECLVRCGVQFSVVELQDIGVVNLRTETRIGQDAAEEKDPLANEKTELGLPISFGTSKKRIRKRVKKSRSNNRKHNTETTSHDCSDPEPEVGLGDIPEKKRKHSRNGDGVQIVVEGEGKAGEIPARLRQQLGRNLFKYWIQRYSLFSKFDDGIQIDKEGFYSVTPECIARHQAQKYNGAYPLLVLDACCGLGGNTIQFALQGHHVIAVDVNASRLRMAQHNTDVYGVSHRIEFLIGDFFDVVDRIQPDVICMSPPWGGPYYAFEDSIVLDITSVLGRFISKTLQCLRSVKDTRAIIYLPRNVDLTSLLRFDVADLHLTELEILKINTFTKAITLYLQS